MGEAHYRFYAELNDFLPPERRFTLFPDRFLDISTVKDRMESFGVPHTEVDLILVNGEAVDFAYRVRDGDRISVYPVFEAFDIAGLTRLRPEPLREPRFVLDTHLGRLAAYLRILGFDALYRNLAGDAELAAASREERRTLLTRDLGLLKRGAVTHGYFVRETNARRQVAEVVRRFDLSRLAKPFSRCLRCNTPLEEAARESVAGRIPARIAEVQEEFRCCPTCGRIYWKGGHYDRMRGWLARLEIL
ncbi:MAG TPA: Mut7-C RNAse domain-containing protein [Bryobacteraceae bacterium]|nr:Mut7-C RNAse domain-containing protein [Bryobacteraceae bacterium]